MVAIDATRLVFAVLAISAGAVGETSPPNCCNASDGAACCPKPPLHTGATNSGDTSSQLKVVYDPERCCPDSSGGAGCAAYGAAGCSFCRDVCDEDDSSCVLCSLADHSGAKPDSSITIQSSKGEWFPPFDPEDMENLWGVFKGVDSADWGENIEAVMSPGSYDFDDGSGEINCSSCAWDNMSTRKQRLLTQRSRSMVCDSSCLHGRGDATYGLTLCNYFNAGKECRACCHEGYEIEGCMPCEGVGSCDTCTEKIRDTCKTDPCGEECQAYVCCGVQWGDYSGCADTMPSVMGELESFINEQCGVLFTCETADITCSDNARTCSATGTVSRRLQEVAQENCATVSVDGAGDFDMVYASSGTLESEVTFMAVDASHGTYALRSVAIDACTGMDSLPFIDAASMDMIVAHSSTGRLAWDDGTEAHPHAVNTGVGCARHVWLLQDTTGSQSYAYATVDPSEHPRYIASDWVKVYSSGAMTRSELTLFCIQSNKKG